MLESIMAFNQIKLLKEMNKNIFKKEYQKHLLLSIKISLRTQFCKTRLFLISSFINKKTISMHNSCCFKLT